MPDHCRFKDARCFACGKWGCVEGQRVQTVHDKVGKECGREATEYNLYAVSTQQSTDPFTVEVSINGENLCMEVETGAAVSLVP